VTRICRLLSIFSLLALAARGCGGNEDETMEPATASCAGRSITVAAAASLTEAFTTIGDQVADICPGSEIAFTFDSSATLATQILEGAPVDVFASADDTSVERVAERYAGEPQVFARNQLVIVTEPGNPAGIEGLADLADAGVVALCAERAPCGRFAAEVLEGAEVTLDEGSVTRGQNAKATLVAVAEGDAVAGIAYVTDAAAAAGGVDAVAIPADQNVVAAYPLVAIDGPGDDALAGAFVAHLLSDEAQAVLADAGFLAP
jgi:molybdate transport system substrate-binding protein